MGKSESGSVAVYREIKKEKIMSIEKQDTNIIVPKEWLERLATLVEKIDNEKDRVLQDSRLSYFLGYVHSLDEFLKK